MRWAPVVIVLALLGLVAAVGIVLIVNQRVLKPRREARWERAKDRATWQDVTTSKDGRTTVVVQRVAVDGNRREVLDQHLVGTVLDGAQNWDQAVHDFQVDALRRVYQLNTGPLS